MDSITGQTRRALSLFRCALAATICLASPPADATCWAGDYRVCPLRGLETPPAGELARIESIVKASLAKVNADHARNRRPGGSGLAHRDAHTKHHGCAKARLRIDSAIPAAIQRGVFQPGADYRAWVRFSNGSSRAQEDKKGDGRGMAIKLMGVGSGADKLLENVFTENPYYVFERRTQDFLMINHPVFFVKDARDYESFTRRAFGFGAAPRLLWHFLWRPWERGILLAIQAKKIASPLGISYHSMGAFSIGDRLAARLSATPVSCAGGWPLEPREPSADVLSDPDYLGRALRCELAEGAHCFEVRLHLKRSFALSIEDPTELWDADRAPAIRVGTLELPQQDVREAGRQQFCENISMTPWHGMREHQPIGGIQRLRLDLYKEVSQLRHRLNGAPAYEPEE